MGGHGYSPWRDLRGRRHVRVGYAELPDGVSGACGHAAGRSAIVLDSRLRRVERRCVLAHELAHEERGTACFADGAPATWDVVMAREERICHDIAVRRLVPADRLRDYCVGISDFLAVEAHEVAVVFDVTETYAARALFLLAANGYGAT